MAIEGPHRELDIHDVFQLLDLGRKTGMLRITSSLRQNAGTVHFEEGKVTGAVIESNPQGVPVFVNGTQQGVTPLSLKVAGGRHEVELRGPGKPRIFNVFVSRGYRVAQYVEFPSRPDSPDR